MELEDECPSPSSLQFDRLSMKSDSPSESQVSCGEDRTRTVVTSLLSALLQPDPALRTAAANSLASIASEKPYLVLSEWNSLFGKEKRKRVRDTPTSSRRNSSAVQSSDNVDHDNCSLLVRGLTPIMIKVTRSRHLDAGDVRHRAVLGQIISTLVEEMLTTVTNETPVCDILLCLSGDYMDKLMDVTLVHFQPNTNPVNIVIVNTLANLARAHPSGVVPFLKPVLTTTAQLIKSVKVSDMGLRLSFSNAITQFFEAILDHNSNPATDQENKVKLEQFSAEADIIYETLFSSWIYSAKEREPKISILTAISSTTTFVSSAFLKEKCSSLVLSTLQMYKKFSVSLSSHLEITLCLSQLLTLASNTHPALLESVLDPVFNTLFQQICISPDYSKQSTVKNHNEILRCYDTMMINYPGKLVNGLLNKVDNSSEERLKVGALVVIKHLLNLPTNVLGDRLEEIFSNIAGKLSEQNRAVQKLIAQTVLMLGKHGAVTGDRGKDCIEFIIRLCGDTDHDTSDLCSNVLQLLTTGVPMVTALLWPATLEYLMIPDYDGSVPAVTRALAHLAPEHGQSPVPWPQYTHCTSGPVLLARLLVLVSVPTVGHRGQHILRFLLHFSHNIHPNLKSLWQSRFPLLLHYLEQHKEVDLGQWQDWLLALTLDTVTAVADEVWTLDLVTALVDQLTLYSSDSREKSFCVLLSGGALTLVTSRQHVMDTLSSIFLVSVERPYEDSKSCSKAFGLCTSKHLEMVMAKLEMLLSNQSSKKSSSFFGLLRDRNNEEIQLKELCLILQCVGQAAIKAESEELSKHCNTMVTRFLAPSLLDCRNSSYVRESVLTAVSDLANALQQVLKLNPDFALPLHEELLHSAINILQNGALPLTSRQQALQCLTSLIELPPNITQMTRCSLLKACFSTIFSSFLEHEASKSEEYDTAKTLETQLNTMVRKLHFLIKELMRQDMEPSTLDEIFTMLEPWLKLDQDLSRELSVNILHGALDTYVKGVKLGVNSPTNFTPGPYMIGAIIPRCFDPSKRVRRIGIDCLQQLLRILGLYEGLSVETMEQSLVQIQSVNTRCNGEDVSSGKLDVKYVSQALVNILGERIQHQHVLSLLDSLVEAILDTQALSVEGTIQVLQGLVVTRGSEVFQNVPGFVRKLHDKMGLMKMDETADMVGEVADVVQFLSVHNTRGVVHSLVNMEQDQDTVTIWQSLASELRLAGDVVDVLLETISGQDQERTVSLLHVTGAAAALSVMLDTRKLEELVRLELGRMVSVLVIMMLRSVHMRSGDQCPANVSVQSLRSVWSSVGCVVVSASLDNVSTLTDTSHCVQLLLRMMEAVCGHASHHVSALVSSHVPMTVSTCADSDRVASAAVLSGAGQYMVSGVERSVVSRLHSTLLDMCSDPLPLVRRLALEAVSAVAVTMEDTSTSVTALVTGVEDEQCSTVSLAALRGLVRILPLTPPHHLLPMVASLALKVRPYFESSSDDHRAAAISVYSCLYTDNEDAARYLDYAATILTPVLLHSNSDHDHTREACLRTLETVAKATQFKPLMEAVTSVSYLDGFSVLMSKIVSCRCGSFIEMYPTLVTGSLSYLHSQNPRLRANVVIMLTELLSYTQTNDKDTIAEETVADIVHGMVNLLKDRDKDVRRTAAENLGRVLLLTTN